MGRGYSASRSKSGRPTVQRKRARSISLKSLKDSVDGKQDHKDQKALSNSLAGGEASEAQASSVKISKRSPSSDKNASETARSSSTRYRSTSLLSQKIKMLEEDLKDQLEASEDDSETVVDTNVMTKYKFAGRAVDEVLQHLSNGCVVGAQTKALCDSGDEKLLELVRGFFSKAKDSEGKKITRGLSFPTSISVNEVLCHHSPLREEEGVILKVNDVVKIHLGCHIDGYPVSAARTVVVASANEMEPQLKEDAQSAIDAARVSLLGMIHQLRPSTVNGEITDFVARVGHHFKVQALEGVLSNRTKRWVPDGVECIIGRRVIEKLPQQDVGTCEIGENQVWTLDVAFTNSPNYNVSRSPEATTLFRRTPEDFLLDPRVDHATKVLKEISDNFFCFPFHLKHLSNPLKGMMGIRMLEQKGVVEEVPVLRVKRPYISARFSATVAITSKRIIVLCGLPEETINGVPEYLKEVIVQPLDFATAAARRREEELKFGSVPQKKMRRE